MHDIGGGRGPRSGVGEGRRGQGSEGSTLLHLLARRAGEVGGALKRIPARPWGLSHVICEIFWRGDPKNGEGGPCEEWSSGFCI